MSETDQGSGDSGTGSHLAIGWATVELDRAAAELGSLLVAGDAFVAAPACVHLGAACRVGRLAPGAGASAGTPWPDARFVVLLEPTTEGRLAATLARFGESWCATWVLRDATAGRRGVGAVSAVRGGPFGAERIVLRGPLAGPVIGPHRLLVEATTIEP